MASGLMVQEEEADKSKPEPEPREVENARLRGVVEPKTIRCGGEIPESYQGGVYSRHWDDGEGVLDGHRRCKE